MPPEAWQPTLVGETVVVRPLSAGDWDAFYGVARDREIWAMHPFHDRWREPVCRRFFDDGLASGGGVAVVLRADDRLIGSSRYRLSDDAQSVEVGWTFLAREYWGGATNREVKRLMIGHALTQIEWVTFRIGAENLRSRRAIEKIGAVPTGDIDWTEVDGVPVEHVVYAIGHAGFAAKLGE